MFSDVARKHSKTASPLGLKVLQILDDTWACYNLNGERLRRIDWTDTEAIRFVWHKELATFDFNELTQLVVRCHDACIRLAIQPCSNRELRLWFTWRAGREGDITTRHPTIEQAIADVRGRNYFGRVEKLPDAYCVPAAEQPQAQAEPNNPAPSSEVGAV